MVNGVEKANIAIPALLKVDRVGQKMYSFHCVSLLPRVMSNYRAVTIV